MRKYGPQLACSCDLLVCDEGHRLKAKGGNKTIDALLALNCHRRVVLTGTPVQNNLDEFYGGWVGGPRGGLLGAGGWGKCAVAAWFELCGCLHGGLSSTSSI
jgi:hypothetical protein